MRPRDEPIDALGGMLAAVRSGHVQRRIDESALAFQSRVEAGEQVIVGVNRFAESEPAFQATALAWPDADAMSRHIEEFRAFKRSRSETEVQAALDKIARSAHSDENTFGLLVEAADVGVTHGEMVAVLRKELGFGMPLVTI